MPLDPNCFEKVAIYLSARALLRVGSISGRTDPFAVLYRIDKVKNQLLLIGTTEVVSDNNNPDWLTSFVVDYQFECSQEFVVKVYNCDGSRISTTELNRHTWIAESRFIMSELMCASGQKLSIAVTAGKSGIAQGQVHVRGESLHHTRDKLIVTFSANNLANKAGFFGTSDPFLSISRVNEDNSRTVVFQNKHIDNTLNPRWAGAKIPLATLCNGDLERPLRIEVLDWDRHGKHVSMGSAETCVRAMLSGTSIALPVIEADKKAKNKSYTNSGTVVVSNCSMELNPTFADFIAGGCEISLVVAIDFTMSNGDPASPSSLHYIDPTGATLNAYQQAIQAVGTALHPYDSDHMYPVYGFGAKIRTPEGYSPAQHCFPVYGGGVEVQGLEGIQQAYRDCVRSVMLSGPTLFGPLVMAAAQTAANMGCSQEKQKYSILLVLTDGVVNDLDQTIAAIVSASYTPLSIVIVGVGSADFAEMHALDSDNTLLSHGGKTAARDIVQFVSFNEVAALGQHALAEHVLMEIPTQLLLYMQQHQITPNPRR